MIKLVRCLLEPEIRWEWDSDVEFATYIPLVYDYKCIGKNYMKLKTRSSMVNQRDIMTKYIHFIDDNQTFYRYESSAYDNKGGSSVLSSERSISNVVRAEQIFKCVRIKRDVEEGTILIDIISNTDYKMGVLSSLIGP
jgi:hypothetical protein